MRQFGLIFKYTLWRNFKHPMSFIGMFVIPLAIMFLFTAVNAFATEVDLIFYGFNVGHTWQVLPNLFFFQLFGALNLIDNMYEVMRGANKWRFFATPIARIKFPFAIMLASWLCTLLQGILLVVITGVILNVNWGAWWVMMLILIGMSLLSQALGLIIYGITKNSGSANAIAWPSLFIIASLSGFILPLNEIINHRIVDFIGEWSPLTLGVNAIWQSSPIGEFIDVSQRLYTGGDMAIAMRNVGLIFAMTALLWVVGLAIGKVRKEW